MARIKLVVADTDYYYISRLSHFLLEKNTTFDAICFTEKELLLSFLQEKKADVFLLSETMFTEDILSKLPQQAISIVLSENNTGIGEYRFVDKYQNTAQMLQEVLLCYAEQTGNDAIMGRKTGSANIIAVYSPMGGSGKTTIALALAALLRKRQKNCIYLNLEEVPSTCAYFSQEQEIGLTEVFLSIKSGKKEVLFSMQKALQTDHATGIQYFLPPESAFEFEEMTEEEYGILFQSLSKLETADFILVDYCSSFSQKRLQQLSYADTIVFVGTETKTAVEKTACFQKECERSEFGKTFGQRMVSIINFYKDMALPWETLLPSKTMIPIKTHEQIAKAEIVQEISRLLEKELSLLVEQMLE